MLRVRARRLLGFVFSIFIFLSHSSLRPPVSTPNLSSLHGVHSASSWFKVWFQRFMFFCEWYAFFFIWVLTITFHYEMKEKRRGRRLATWLWRWRRGGGCDAQEAGTAWMMTNLCFLMLSWYLYLIDILGFWWWHVLRSPILCLWWSLLLRLPFLFSTAHVASICCFFFVPELLYACCFELLNASSWICVCF